MTIWQRMAELRLSRYRISKVCGLSWDEASDICCGRKPLPQCAPETLAKLACALSLSIEELMKLETGPQQVSYLEASLPGFLQKSIDDCLRGEREQVDYLDCLYDDLYGSINSAQWGGDITREQADYLREKYLHMESPEDRI